MCTFDQIFVLILSFLFLKKYLEKKKFSRKSTNDPSFARKDIENPNAVLPATTPSSFVVKKVGILLLPSLRGVLFIIFNFAGISDKERAKEEKLENSMVCS